MILAIKDENQRKDYSSTHPKLSLLKLPYKNKTTAKEPLATIAMVTPSLRPPVSVPFRWEDAPGKPRATANGGGSPAKCNVTRSLELPPRLLASSTTIKIPTTVLDGPYVGRSISCTSFSFRKCSAVACIREGVGPAGKGIGGVVKFGSGRWEGFKGCNKEEDDCNYGSSNSSEISRTTLGVMMKREEQLCVVEIARVTKRRKSFLFGSSTKKSYKLLDGIYASFKQALAWRT